MIRFLLPLAALVVVPVLAPAADAPALHPTIPLLDSPTQLPAGVIAVAPDGSWAALHRWPYPATGTPPLTIQFWHLDTGTLTRSVEVVGNRLSGQTLSPDGRQLLLRVERGKSRVNVVIDTRTGRQLTLPESVGSALGFSADGTKMYGYIRAMTGQEAIIGVWSLPAGEKVREFGVPDFHRVDLGLDGKTAHVRTAKAIGNEVWDFETGKRVCTFEIKGETKLYRNDFLAFADGCKKVITEHWDHELRVFDAKTGKLERTVKVPPVPWNSSVRMRGVSDDFSTALVETYEGEPAVFEPGKDRWRVMVPAAPPEAAGRPVLTRDGKRFLRIHPAYGVEVFDAVSGKRLHTLRPDTQHVRSLAFAADGKTLVAATGNDPRQRYWGPEDPPVGHLLVWDTATGELRKGIPGIDAAVCTAFPSPDGTKAVAITGKGWVGWSESGPQGAELWDLAAGKRLKTIAAEKDDLHGFVASANGRRLAAVVTEKKKEGTFFAVFPVGTRVWNLATGERERDLAAAPEAYILSFTPDGERLLFLSRNDKVESWGVESGKSRPIFTAPIVVYSSPDPGGPFLPQALPTGDAFVALLGPHTNIRDPVRLYTDNRQIAFGRINMRPGPLAVSPDGKWAAASERPYVGPARVFVWKIPNPPPLDEKTIKDGVIRPEQAWVEPVVLHGHTGQIHAIAFSPDGKTLASGGEDCAIRMWDVATGRLKATLWAPPTAHAGGEPKDWVAFTPEGFFAGTPRGRAFLRFTDATPSTFFGLRDPAPPRTASDLEKQLLNPAKVKDSLGSK
jgi:WD40 repeat protein